MISEIMAGAKEKMEKALEATKDDFASVRTGRANPAMFQKVMVEEPDTQEATILGISVKANVAFIMSAPRKIKNTMAVVSAVLNNAACMPESLSSFLTNPNSMVKTAPTPAPSVGENTPP